MHVKLFSVLTKMLFFQTMNLNSHSLLCCYCNWYCMPYLHVYWHIQVCSPLQSLGMEGGVTLLLGVMMSPRISSHDSKTIHNRGVKVYKFSESSLTVDFPEP